MGVGVFFHHIGTFLLLVATVLLIVVSITSPVVNNLSILKVDLASNVVGSKVTYGTFGYCHMGLSGGDECTGVHIGYRPTDILDDIDNIPFSNRDRDGARVLTKVLILHPIAAALCFLGFLLCLAPNIVGSFIASVFSGLAFVSTLVAMICDFAGFRIIKHAVNSKSNSGSVARWGPAVWLMIVAAICTLVATVLIFVTCCAGRVKKGREHRRSKEAPGY